MEHGRPRCAHGLRRGRHRAERGAPGWGGLPAQAPVPLPAGRWRVRAVHTEADEENWVGLVQILPVED